MEVSPRGGGNRLSEVIHYATGVDLISYTIKAALGEEIKGLSQPSYKGNWAEVIVYSNENGKFKELQIDPELDDFIVEVDLWVKKGDKINAFTGANEAIGTIVLKFDNAEKLDNVLSKYAQHFKVNIE